MIVSVKPVITTRAREIRTRKRTHISSDSFHKKLPTIVKVVTERTGSARHLRQSFSFKSDSPSSLALGGCQDSLTGVTNLRVWSTKFETSDQILMVIFELSGVDYPYKQLQVIVFGIFEILKNYYVCMLNFGQKWVLENAISF